MAALIVVANRAPVTFYEDSDGIHSRHPSGGLAPSLAWALEGTDAVFVAAAMSEVERRIARGDVHIDQSNLLLVDLDPQVTQSAYRVIANGVLWFLHHDLFDRTYRPVFNKNFHEAWAGYRAYNDAFAQTVAGCADENTIVVVHDYHMSLVGKKLAELRPDLRTVHFSHTPFCTKEELGTLPQAIARELIEAMASFGSCGFHAKPWAENFVGCARAMLGAAPPVFVAPLGVDAEELIAKARQSGCRERRDALVDRLGGRKLIVRSDRIELSKNLLRGFLAFEELLETRPQWRDRVVFLARVYPSREEQVEYLAYRAAVEQCVARINDRFASTDYLPIVFKVEDDFESSLAALSCYNVLLVNAVRDGMNLVAKEGSIVNDTAGVLALSHGAGAFEELGSAALEIDPFDVSGTASVLDLALTMDGGEKAARADRLRVLAGAHPPRRWLEDLLAHARVPSPIGS